MNMRHHHQGFLPCAVVALSRSRLTRKRQRRMDYCCSSSSSLASCSFLSHMLLLLLSSSSFPLPAATGFISLRLHFHGAAKVGMLRSTATSHSNKEHGKTTPNEIGIGIDLGTTFSCVAFLKDNALPTIISIPYNGRTMPSLVSLGPDGQVWVGKKAITHAATSASASGAAYNYCNVKRVIGTGGKISKDIAQVVPHVVRNPSGKTYKKNSLVNQIYDAQEYPTLLQSSSAILERRQDHAHAQAQQALPQETTRTTIQPEVIVSYILARLKAVAEEYTGCRVTRAVIGVPAYFHDAQRAATIKAAAMAGMHKVKLLREPEAAALAYGIGKQQQQQEQVLAQNSVFADDYNKDELVLVFDLGGGTFDVSMLLVGGGVTEIVCTSGDVQLGGSDFDRRVANHFQKLLTNHGASSGSIARNWSAVAKNSIVRCAEAVRIHLSNNRKALLALPLLEESWTNSSQMDVMLPLDFENQTAASLISESGTSNSTHVIVEFTRQRMEQLCKEEFQALLRPVREVAIMSGALLPGDSRPSLVEAALEMEQALQQRQQDEELLFDDFYKDEEEDLDDEVSIEDERILLQLQEAGMKQAKKDQQRGRRRSRTLAKDERKYREERRKLENKKDTTRGQSSSSSSGKDVGNVKVRDGISGRPISRVVLVGGATRMPAIGRLIATLTGVVPQKTVNPDEAVALGCAVHVGVLDGVEGMGTVLNPMQAAILHAVAQQQQQQQQQGLLDTYDNDEDGIDDDEFSEVVEYS